MPCETQPRFVVLYGSQKGQAQSIAEGIAEEAQDHGLGAELSCLSENEKVTFLICKDINLICFHIDCGNRSHWLIIWFQYNLEKESAPVVFILSTTGDGEPPDNALRFVKRIKKKNLSTDHYKHLCYALLGKFYQAVWGSALALFVARYICENHSSLSEQFLAGEIFIVLPLSAPALGDTNYANFCNCGKTVERRLQELGATQFYAAGYADDGVG